MVFDSPCATKLNNMNKLQIEIAKQKVKYAEQNLNNIGFLDHTRYCIESEEEMFSKMIHDMGERGIECHASVIRAKMNMAQRERFFEQLSEYSYFDRDDASEEEFILHAKLLIYNI